MPPFKLDLGPAVQYTPAEIAEFQRQAQLDQAAKATNSRCAHRHTRQWRLTIHGAVLNQRYDSAQEVLPIIQKLVGDFPDLRVITPTGQSIDPMCLALLVRAHREHSTARRAHQGEHANA